LFFHGDLRVSKTRGLRQFGLPGSGSGTVACLGCQADWWAYQMAWALGARRIPRLRYTLPAGAMMNGAFQLASLMF
jgi:hypothetical protein